MNKQIRTKLQFILGGILLVIFAVSGCNNNGEAPPPPVKDSMDTANEAPVIETKPK